MIKRMQGWCNLEGYDMTRRFVHNILWTIIAVCILRVFCTLETINNQTVCPPPIIVFSSHIPPSRYLRKREIVQKCTPY